MPDRWTLLMFSQDICITYLCLIINIAAELAYQPYVPGNEVDRVICGAGLGTSLVALRRWLKVHSREQIAGLSAGAIKRNISASFREKTTDGSRYHETCISEVLHDTA